MSVIKRPKRLIIDVKREFVCPKRNLGVTCTVAKDVMTGRFLAVKDCSAYTNEEIYRGCRGDCLDALNSELSIVSQVKR